ncbi:MAG: hypothetical protein ACFFA6_14635 [Promethearchaeota archaeon]
MPDFTYKIVYDGPVDENLESMIENGLMEEIHDISKNKIIIGVDFYKKKFNLFNTEIDAHIWILNQAEMFKSIKATYYRDANLILFVKLNNSSTVDKLIEFANNTKINPNQIIILETSDDFTEKFFEHAIVIALFNDGSINASKFREKELHYKKTDNPEYTLLSDYLESQEFEIKTLKHLLKIQEEEIEELRTTIEFKEKQINNLKESLKSKDKLIRSQINEMNIIANSVRIKENELEELRKKLKLKDEE